MAANGGPAATGISFADWRRTTNDSLMSTAESLLERLEDVADMLLQIDESYTKQNEDNKPDAAVDADATRQEIVERFHEGVENARNINGVLKKEKWRLSRREMSVEMRMGELEDYKSHLQSDMSSLNQTVDVLSLRVVQLENQLVEAQETQEQLEAQIAEYKKWLTDSQQQNLKLKRSFELLESQTPHTLITENTMVRNEIAVLLDENKKLKELIRNAETVSPPATDEHLTRLTRDFLKQLSSLDCDEQTTDSRKDSHDSGVCQSSDIDSPAVT